jgi:hypothetical protein
MASLCNERNRRRADTDDSVDGHDLKSGLSGLRFVKLEARDRVS